MTDLRVHVWIVNNWAVWADVTKWWEEGSYTKGNDILVMHLVKNYPHNGVVANQMWNYWYNEVRQKTKYENLQKS